MFMHFDTAQAAKVSLEPDNQVNVQLNQVTSDDFLINDNDDNMEDEAPAAIHGGYLNLLHETEFVARPIS